MFMMLAEASVFFWGVKFYYTNIACMQALTVLHANYERDSTFYWMKTWYSI